VDGPTTDDPGLTKALLAAGDPDRADAQGSVPAGSAPDGRADRLRHTPARAELPKVLRAVARGKAAEGRLGRPGPQRTEPPGGDAGGATAKSQGRCRTHAPVGGQHGPEAVRRRRMAA